MLTIFIDESGTLPDPKDKFVVVCGVRVRKIKEAENIFSRILASLKRRKIRIREIKFYYAGQNTKRRFFQGLHLPVLKFLCWWLIKKEER